MLPPRSLLPVHRRGLHRRPPRVVVTVTVSAGVVLCRGLAVGGARGEAASGQAASRQAAAGDTVPHAAAKVHLMVVEGVRGPPAVPARDAVALQHAQQARIRLLVGLRPSV